MVGWEKVGFIGRIDEHRREHVLVGILREGSLAGSMMKCLLKYAIGTRLYEMQFFGGGLSCAFFELKRFFSVRIKEKILTTSEKLLPRARVCVTSRHSAIHPT